MGRSALHCTTDRSRPSHKYQGWIQCTSHLIAKRRCPHLPRPAFHTPAPLRLGGHGNNHAAPVLWRNEAQNLVWAVTWGAWGCGAVGMPAHFGTHVERPMQMGLLWWCWGRGGAGALLEAAMTKSKAFPSGPLGSPRYESSPGLRLPLFSGPLLSLEACRWSAEFRSP